MMPIRLNRNDPRKVDSTRCVVRSDRNRWVARGVTDPDAAASADTMIPSEKVTTDSMELARTDSTASTAPDPSLSPKPAGSLDPISGATKAVPMPSTV